VFERGAPGLLLGCYPERRESRSDWLDRRLQMFAGWLQRQLPDSGLPPRRLLRRVNRYGAEISALADDELQVLAGRLRQQLRYRGCSRKAAWALFALIREVAGRRIGQRHFDEQIMGGWAMLQGHLAEMETGEGKTLTATLPACAAALAGIPVHIVSVNDYLVNRDAENMRPVYEFLGLSVGVITAGMEEATRRRAWEADVVYCTGKQLAFDYLHDRIILRHAPGRLALQVEKLHSREPRSERLLMRGLCFAIVDEADSVLIDEAVTPLIISHSGECDARLIRRCEKALALAGALAETRDFLVNHETRELQLTPAGEERLAAAIREPDTEWSNRTWRTALVTQALTAIHRFQRDRDYLVRDGRIEIIDDFTGRILGGRTWEHGLHQMIELKEGCEVSAPCETLARVSYQRFFSRYLRLAGMTGTAREAGSELQAVYGLKISRIPTHRPSRLSAGGVRIYPTTERKWHAVLERVRAVHAEHRPILIGTRSVAESERISRLLDGARLPHRVLNARQDADEAAIVARAGGPGAITVATNMAGRGTDIPLAPGVAAAGGLHVIAVELNESRRIDRQLFGRCARQGAPGSHESILSLEDALFSRFAPKCLQALAAKCVKKTRPVPRWKAGLLIRVSQFRCEWIQRRRRRDLAGMEEYFGKLLAFSGRQD
jgi:preprotein translocase subunit SecA